MIPLAAPRPLALAALLLLGALLAGCSSLRAVSPWREVPRRLSADEVPAAIETARAALAAGEHERALDWVRAARKSRGLPTDVLDELQEVTEEIVAYRIDLLDTPEGDPQDLVDLLDLELPRQLAVTGGVRAAQRLFADGRRMKAFEVIQKIDTKFPAHHERAAAGTLVADIGFSLAEDPGKLWGIWTRWGRPKKVLEYLVLNYPRELRCDRACAELARLYERDRAWQLAIERHQDLIQWHVTSPLVPASEARIPHLRLVRIESPEYDRQALVQARSELERWLGRHAGHPLEESVRADRLDCLRRLAENDLVVARFYDRVGNEPGRTWHARRALAEARDAGDEERAARALALLEAPTRAPRRFEDEEGAEAENGEAGPRPASPVEEAGP